LITVRGSFFRFVDDDHYELSPSGVTDALGKVMVFDHPLDVQIFDFDALILGDQLSRLFEMKVASLSFHFQMLLRQQTNRFLSSFASFDIDVFRLNNFLAGVVTALHLHLNRYD
jgi:hypothetical protein